MAWIYSQNKRRKPSENGGCVKKAVSDAYLQGVGNRRKMAVHINKGFAQWFPTLSYAFPTVFRQWRMGVGNVGNTFRYPTFPTAREIGSSCGER